MDIVSLNLVSFSAYLSAQRLDLQGITDYLDNNPSHQGIAILREVVQKHMERLNAFAEVFPEDSILMMSDWENQFASWVSETEYQAKKAA
jgi:hypothetical protein